MHPEWLNVAVSRDRSFSAVEKLTKDMGLNTVCMEASCPNIYECWSENTATFMLLGDVCTRGCRFCHVRKGAPQPVDSGETDRIVAAATAMGLKYVVLTSVDRDDLADGGSGHFAACIKKLKSCGFKVECLIPDFSGRGDLLRNIVDAGPDVIAHNIETVERLQSVRDARAGYRQSLRVLRMVKDMNPDVITKSSMMLGMGESDVEVLDAMKDLKSAGVGILVVSQYLRPSASQVPVASYVRPEKFLYFREMAESMGFVCVSGPLVRTSYRAAASYGAAGKSTGAPDSP